MLSYFSNIWFPALYFNTDFQQPLCFLKLMKYPSLSPVDILNIKINQTYSGINFQNWLNFLFLINLVKCEFLRSRLCEWDQHDSLQDQLENTLISVSIVRWAGCSCPETRSMQRLAQFCVELLQEKKQNLDLVQTAWRSSTITSQQWLCRVFW